MLRAHILFVYGVNLNCDDGLLPSKNSSVFYSPNYFQRSRRALEDMRHESESFCNIWQFIKTCDLHLHSILLKCFSTIFRKNCIPYVNVINCVKVIVSLDKIITQNILFYSVPKTWQGCPILDTNVPHGNSTII